MNRLAIEPTLGHQHSPATPIHGSKVSALPNLLVLVIFLTDLLTPFLIWKGVLPSVARWIADLSVVVILGLLFLRMLSFNRFPVGFWLLTGVVVFSGTQATLQGQHPAVTLWGGWQTFQMPLLALFVYLNPHWPSNFGSRLRQICVAILIGQVLVQIMQYVTGEPIGDSLAGTFGFFGVSPLLMFCVFTISLTLGHGAISGDWRSFMIAFVAGLASSVLAENKIFPIATLLMAVIAVWLYVSLGGKWWKLVPYSVLLVGGLVLFFVGYNLLVPAAERRTLQQFFLDQETSERYNELFRSVDGVDGYELGRNVAAEYGWNFIRSHVDPTVFLFGLGLGAKTESRSLGLIGIAFEQDGLGFTPGTGAMVLFEEMGIMGVVIMLIFMVSTTYILFLDLKRDRRSPAAQVRAAVIIFTLLWPLWLWYKAVFWFRVTMLLYWVSIGYIFRERYLERRDEQSTAAVPPSS